MMTWLNCIKHFWWFYDPTTKDTLFAWLCFLVWLNYFQVLYVLIILKVWLIVCLDWRFLILSLPFYDVLIMVWIVNYNIFLLYFLVVNHLILLHHLVFFIPSTIVIFIKFSVSRIMTRDHFTSKYGFSKLLYNSEAVLNICFFPLVFSFWGFILPNLFKSSKKLARK